MSRKSKDVTAKVQTMRDEVQAEASELERAVQKHVEASVASCAAAAEVQREARRRSITPR